jgi:hypothetical protein
MFRALNNIIGRKVPNAYFVPISGDVLEEEKECRNALRDDIN